ncbi:MAG: T9SS type A sorting domain-containing protein [Bacteroidales bacterium]|nr:T9SS type A sorting domain-containing protein [Bacteroidales bacterium]
MARKNLTFALLALMAITVHAQHFEWAKNFYGYGDKYVNFPCGLVTDSEGNVYHLMQVASGGTLDNIDPFEVVSNYNPSALLVKMSPDGEYLWHRIINPYERDNTSAVDVLDLRMLGDTALMMMVNIQLPYTENAYGLVEVALYYLDTLLTTSELLMPTDSIHNRCVTAFITLGLDGTLKEQHFLQVTYLDSLGHPVMGRSGVDGNGLTSEHFDVDSRGNIYVVRLTQDRAFPYLADPLYFHDGGLSGYRFMVDGTRFLTYIPTYTTGWWNQQVLKFSPHFDSLLDASYIAGVAPWVDSFSTNPLSIRSFDIHDDDQIYITFNTRIEHHGIPIARSNGLQIETDSLSLGFGSDCMLRLDTSLNANLLMQFDYVPHSDGGYSSVFLSATCVDTVTGSLFVLGCAGTDSWGGNSQPHQFIYRGDTLSNRNSAFWLRVGADDGHYLSYGHINSDLGDNGGGKGIVARDNRVFAQIWYSGNIQFAGFTFSTPNASQRGLALAQWDYDGHEVAIHDFHCNHSNSSPGHMLLIDTSLYITGNSFSTPTTFGDIACGMGQYIAKLTDTSMGSPYVYDTTSHGGEVSITLVEDKATLVAYPNPFRQSVRIKVESGQLKEHNGTVTAILTDMTGRREEVRLTPTGDGQYSLDLTSHPQAAYLLTLITADGHHHTLKLLKQSDFFGN